MRTRQEIEKDLKTYISKNWGRDALILEVLLDIREIAEELKKRNI